VPSPSFAGFGQTVQCGLTERRVSMVYICLSSTIQVW